ncbi:hypothetical protein ACLOJK_016495 [Asimina triloba]
MLPSLLLPPLPSCIAYHLEMDDDSNEIIHDYKPFFRIYKNGRVERFINSGTVPPSTEPTGVTSKDVVIQADPAIGARLYLPKLADPPQKLPILVYYHGGAFCIESAYSPHYQRFLNTLVAQANIVAVSVDYRLAPEHLLPAAYEDCWAALQWVASHASGSGPEPWIADHADFSRLIIAGDSAGGNITHNIALRAGREEIGHGVKIDGAMVIHPYFWGAESIGDEMRFRKLEEGKPNVWLFICPGTSGLDDPRINPMAEGALSLSGLGCVRLLVCVAQLDMFKDRGWLYYRTVEGSGWTGTLDIYPVDEEDHVYHLLRPETDNARLMIKRLSAFLNP